MRLVQLHLTSPRFLAGGEQCFGKDNHNNNRDDGGEDLRKEKCIMMSMQMIIIHPIYRQGLADGLSDEFVQHRYSTSCDINCFQIDKIYILIS